MIFCLMTRLTFFPCALIYISDLVMIVLLLLSLLVLWSRRPDPAWCRWAERPARWCSRSRPRRARESAEAAQSGESGVAWGYLRQRRGRWGMEVGASALRARVFRRARAGVARWRGGRRRRRRRGRGARGAHRLGQRGRRCWWRGPPRTAH